MNDSLGMIALRALGIYVLVLIVLRILGKRTVGNFTAFDLLVALMLGEVVDEIIYGDVRFLQGTVAIVVIGGLAYLDSWLAYFGHGFETVLEGKPTIVVRDGEFDRIYLTHMVADHQEMLSLLIHEKGAGQNADLGRLASETLPTIVRHLESAKAALAALNETPLEASAGRRLR